MNVIFDTLEEIQRMRKRKVKLEFFKILHLVSIIRPKLWYDCLFCFDDLENFDVNYKYRKSSSCSFKVA